MALTTEQAEAIDTAIDNLNKSVQVNAEVLQIIKSMQSTSAAGSVAEHNNNLDAHPTLNNLKVLNDFKFGGINGKTSTYSGIRATQSYLNSTKQGVSRLELFGCWGESRGSTSKISGYSRNADLTNTNFKGKSVLSINAYGTTDNGDHLFSNLTFRVDGKGYGHAYIGIVDSLDGSTAIQYNFYKDNIAPAKDADIGSSTYQWKDLYLKNSPIVSSDRRLKQDIANIPEAVFRAWEKVNFCQYRFKEAVEKKGSEARLHVGMIAQEILEAFNSQGLNATDYGIVCHDSWEDQYQDVEVGVKPAVLNEKGEVVVPEEPIMEYQLIKKAGDLWTVRYEEALALEAAYQRWKLKKLEDLITLK